MNVKKEHIIVTLMPIALTPEARLPVLVSSDMWRMMKFAKVKILILNLCFISFS